MKVSVKKIQVSRKDKPVAKWRVDYTDQYGKRHRPIFDTSAEAHHERQKIEEAMRKGTHRPDPIKKQCASYLSSTLTTSTVV